jgi:hypothetical protein
MFHSKEMIWREHGRHRPLPPPVYCTDFCHERARRSLTLPVAAIAFQQQNRAGFAVTSFAITPLTEHTGAEVTGIHVLNAE